MNALDTDFRPYTDEDEDEFRRKEVMDVQVAAKELLSLFTDMNQMVQAQAPAVVALLDNTKETLAQVQLSQQQLQQAESLQKSLRSKAASVLLVAGGAAAGVVVAIKSPVLGVGLLLATAVAGARRLLAL